MSEKKNVPKLRFPEFTEPWEQRKVGDVLTESRDLGHSGDIAKKLTVKLWGKGVCAKDDKGSASTQYFIRHAEQFIYSKLDFLNSAFGVIPNELENYESTADLPAFNCIGVNPYFMFYRAIQPSFYLTNGMIADGSRKAKRIHVNTFLEMPLDLPSMDEQRKIENFFTSLDHLITLHQRKLDHVKDLKKSMLQKMFPKNGQLYPEVRFPEFTDAWEQRKLGEICERITRKNKGNESDLPLTIASQYGLIDQRDFFNKVVAAKDMTNYYLLKKGEFAYNKSYSNGFDYGSIKRLNEYEKGCLSTLYVCFGITSDEVDSDYLECFFDTLNWYHDVATICAEGARNHGLLNVDVKAFFTDVKISLPLQKEEQKRIAECFQQVDTLITLHQRELDHLKLLKKGMLQQMFV